MGFALRYTVSRAIFRVSCHRLRIIYSGGRGRNIRMNEIGNSIRVAVLRSTGIRSTGIRSPDRKKSKDRFYKNA